MPPWLLEFQSKLEEEAAHWLRKGHELDEDGEHDEEECYQCFVRKEVRSACRCGECCRRLIIEVDLEDAKREPKIAELGSPTYQHPALTESGQRELIGYLLNSRDDIACIFLDRHTNLCTIYGSRPLACRLFDCDGAGRQKLIELGILPLPHSS